MATIKKALRTSLRRRRYTMFEQKENDYVHTPSFKRCASESGEQRGASSDPSSQTTSKRQSAMSRRGSQVRRSVRDVVGVIRQKFRASTQRLAPLRENRVGAVTTPNRASRRLSRSKEVAMYSPFHIETPTRGGRVQRRNNIRTVVSLETPTRLRREVEALTANMQALSALTPNTLQEQRRVPTTQKSPYLTNGSLKTPRQARRRINTNV